MVNGPTAGALRAPETVADRMLAAHGKSFHWARRFLGATAARQATLLYAFCRLLDDIADGDAPGGEIRLRALDARLAGDQAVHAPEAEAFLSFAAEAGIPVSAARDLIAGLLFDQGQVLLQTEAELICYAYQVAGTVGLMMAPILGRSDPHADAFAVDLGIAMQLTNIARDVGEDALERRIYLPLDWMQEAGLEVDAFFDNPRPTKAVRQMVRRLLMESNRLYYRSEAGISKLPVGSRTGIYAARYIYAGIGSEVQALGYETITQRAHTNKLQKLGWLARSILSTGVSIAMPQSAVLYAKPLPEVQFLVDAAAEQASGKRDWRDKIVLAMQQLREGDIAKNSSLIR